MQVSVKNQVNNSVAMLHPSTKLLPSAAKLPKAKLATMLNKADKLRANADESFKNYVVAGREALLVLVGEMYALYCEIKKDADEAKKVFEHMTSKVAPTSQVRTTSSDASVLVRYICREMSDKKASVYSRCIGLAHKNNVPSNGLAGLVKSTPNGWLGVLNKFSPAKTGDSASTAVQTAEQEVRKAATVATISATDWANDETVRVYIATYNDDATADIKNALLSTEGIAIVLKRFASEKKQLEKLAKTSGVEGAMSKTAIILFENDIGNSEVDIGNLRADIDAAVAAGKTSLVANLRDKLQVLELKLVSYKNALKKEKAAQKVASAKAMLA